MKNINGIVQGKAFRSNLSTSITVSSCSGVKSEKLPKAGPPVLFDPAYYFTCLVGLSLVVDPCDFLKAFAFIEW